MLICVAIFAVIELQGQWRCEKLGNYAKNIIKRCIEGSITWFYYISIMKKEGKHWCDFVKSLDQVVQNTGQTTLVWVLRVCTNLIDRFWWTNSWQPYIWFPSEQVLHQMASELGLNMGCSDFSLSSFCNQKEI